MFDEVSLYPLPPSLLPKFSLFGRREAQLTLFISFLLVNLFHQKQCWHSTVLQPVYSTRDVSLRLPGILCLLCILGFRSLTLLVSP